MKTMKADEQLNWMKLNVYRFMNSESVLMMSAEEVGQYCLLLFTAWQLGKDCTLPNDPRFMERVARGPIAETVLKRFEEVDGRLVNRVQLEIWNEGKELWKVASDSGKKGNEVRWRKKEDRPPVAPQSGADREFNRFDVIRKEKNSAAATLQQPAAEQKDMIHFSPPSHHNAPAATASPTAVTDVDDFDLEFYSPAQLLARFLYNGLPEENKAAAPEAWEAIWVKDLEDGLSLDRENYDEVGQVLEYAVKKKDKHGVRIYVRAKSFVDNYAKLLAETRKIDKAKTNGHSSPSPAVPLLTKTEQAQSGKCEHGLKPKDCQDCYMEAAAL